MHNWLTLEGLTTQCVIWLREGGGQRENLWGHSFTKELHEGTGEEFLKQGAPYGFDSGSHHDQLCSCHTARVTHFPLSASGQLGEETQCGTVPHACWLSAGVSSLSRSLWKERTGRARNGPLLKWQLQKIKAISGRLSKMPSSQGKGQPRKFWF